jgi:hypothetical protein
MTKYTVCTLAIADLSVFHREVAKMLGMDYQNIRKNITRQEELDVIGTTFWISCCRVKRSDLLPKGVRELVLQWWTFYSIVSPNRKDIICQRIGMKQFEEHPRHYLQVPYIYFLKNPHPLVAMNN